QQGIFTQFRVILLGLRGCARRLSPSVRRKRQMTPEDKKDDASYWEKRRKNNEAAKRSREKRRVNDYVLETRLVALSEENMRLRAELLALRLRFGLQGPAACGPNQHNLLPLLPHGTSVAPSIDAHWGRWPADRVHPPLAPFSEASAVLHAAVPPEPQVHSPAGMGYPFVFDRFPSIPSTHSSLFLPTFLPHPSSSWSSLPPPRPILAPKAAPDEEGEQRVPAAGETDMGTALPHKLRLKTRGPQGKPDSTGKRKKQEDDSSPPRERLYVSD
uniref:Nuclear factor, interleukin 3 regulated, member 4 n=1 Tax=Scleropages formosus TaxID=113540 RepID=A0A8C9TC19_SCLFO